MSLDPATTPSPEAPATPPDAGAGAPETGSRLNIGEHTLIRVPHPDLVEDGQHPEGPAPKPAAQPAPQPPDTPAAKRPAEGGAAPNPGESSPAASPAGEPYAKLKYKGREIAVATREDLERMASEGLDYTVKTQMLAPHINDLKALARLRSDPATAARLEALLRGEATAAPDGPAGGQGGPAPAKGKLPTIYVRDAQGNLVYGEDGQPVAADPTFVHAVHDMVREMGLGQAAPAGIPRELAPLVTERQVDQVDRYVREIFGREDFKTAIPAIQQAMVQAGIAPGDPRDNPDTWISIYTHLAMTNQIPAANPAAASPPAGGQGDPGPSVRRPSMSDVKAVAQAPSLENKTPPGLDREAALQRALKEGGMKNWHKAVGAMIHHPALDEEG